MIMTTARISMNPKVMMGKPVIKGTRVTVEILLKKLAQNLAPNEILKNYPQLSEDDIKAAIDFAAESLGSESVHVVLDHQS
jgi:uncharacterized protein (DUF433 family)